MTEVYNHPIALSVIGDTFTNALMHETNNVGMLLDSAFDLNSAELRSCQTFADVLANDAALLAIGDSEKLGAMLFALSPSNYINFVGSDYSLLRMSRQGLLKKAFFSEQHIEVAREKSHIERTLVTYAKQFVEEVDSTFTFDRDLFVVVVAVGAGADGAVNGKGGDGGDYLQKIMSVKEGATINVSISKSGTTCNELAVSLGKGDGAVGGAELKAGSTPSQYGKILKVSTGGGASGDNLVGGGGGGYGGGNGTAGEYGGAGGVGSKQLTISSTGGGGGGRGASYSSSFKGCGGGGGYGGGGGGTRTKYASGYTGGVGGAGCLVIFM